MNKPIALILILLIAPILGSIYGTVHDQITYTISEEYYTKFKFVQFGLDGWGMGENIGTLEAPEIILDHPRFGVSIIGVLATWWVGMIIGIVLGLVGLIHESGKTMFKVTIKAFVLTIGIALIIGLIGLVYGKFILVNNSADWPLPDNLIDRTNFVMVGSMHNFSYIGGLIGMVCSLVFSIRINKKENNEKNV